MKVFHHLSVLPEEVISFLSPENGGTYLDGTLGGAGHAALLFERAPAAFLVGIDRDREALAAAGVRLEAHSRQLRLIHGDFADVTEHMAAAGIEGVDGFLLDLGVSSHQLDTRERGFSFQLDAPLDMRMDTQSGKTAADLLRELPEVELERIIAEFGEERWARRIAAFIAKERLTAPIERTLQLVDIIKGAVPKAKWDERIHPATRTFQALRMAVNSELESLGRGLRGALDLLKPGGRGVVISFHSLEDRIVKKIFREYAQGCVCPRQLPMCVCSGKPRVTVLTGRPVTASETETAANPRARSAKLRAVTKL